MDHDELLGERGWAMASLRVASDTLGSEAISELLGLRPTSTRDSEGAPSFTVWLLEGGLEPSSPIEDHLYILMERLADRVAELAQLVDMANVEIWLSYSPGTGSSRSAVFSHDVLAQIGALGIDLVLDPYPPGRRHQPVGEPRRASEERT